MRQYLFKEIHPEIPEEKFSARSEIFEVHKRIIEISVRQKIIAIFFFQFLYEKSEAEHIDEKELLADDERKPGRVCDCFLFSWFEYFLSFEETGHSIRQRKFDGVKIRDVPVLAIQFFP